MKKLVGFLSVFLFLQVFAQENYGSLTNFNLNYTQPSGVASSDYFSFQEISYLNPTEYSVELQAGSLFLETPKSSIQIDTLPAFITEVDQLDVKNLNFNSNKSKISLDVSELSSKSTDSSVNLNGLYIACEGLENRQDVLSDLLDKCLNRSGEVTLGNFVDQDNNRLRNFTMTAENGILRFRITAQGRTIRGEGETYFENGTVRIKITKARYGIIGVRGRLFRELRAMESEKVTINNPWIEITL